MDSNDIHSAARDLMEGLNIILQMALPKRNGGNLQNGKHHDIEDFLKNAIEYIC
ncbi:hypothetical protein PDJAM_G00107400 [Pangasius djambal]|uniref:Uncharacterized protein n=1 Tax=Pangasius djambal TaxID=1691987 RepID=A0ACC5Y1C0_9TELE|nr:hypothetical protein [Pangasius djambal]